jgi:hypothetical protein
LKWATFILRAKNTLLETLRVLKLDLPEQKSPPSRIAVFDVNVTDQFMADLRDHIKRNRRALGSPSEPFPPFTRTTLTMLS